MTDWGSTKALTFMALPALPLSQGIDFFMHDKNFVPKGVVYQKKCVYLQIVTIYYDI